MKLTTAITALTSIYAMGTAFAQQTIVDIAVADEDNFSTLVAAVTQAGLADTLSGDGPFTVFAPTNEAFNNTVPAETLKMLLEDDWKSHLQAILLYHVVDGSVMSTDLSDGMTTPTLLDMGEVETVSVSLPPVQVNDANVVNADVEASNGVIHVIDKVLLPPFMTNDIVATAQSIDNFSILAELVVIADLVEALQGSGLTVFAPTNAAFEALGEETLNSLKLPENSQMLVDILSYHVVPGIVTSDQLEFGATVPTLLEGKELSVSLNPVQINGVDVILPDVLTSNGVIHIVDEVIMVPDDSSEKMDEGDDKDDSGAHSVSSVVAGVFAIATAMLF